MALNEKRLIVSEFDFDDVKSNLKTFLEAQNEFKIKSTPSFIINGQLLIEGNKPIKDFRQIIDKILSQ